MARCNNCFQDDVWCGCDVYKEFKGTISLSQAMDIKAKRNKEKGMNKKNSIGTY